MIFNANLDELKRDVDGLRLQTEALRVEGDRIRGQLDCFDCEGFEMFRKEVLIPEQDAFRWASAKWSHLGAATRRRGAIVGRHCVSAVVVFTPAAPTRRVGLQLCLAEL